MSSFAKGLNAGGSHLVKLRAGRSCGFVGWILGTTFNIFEGKAWSRRKSSARALLGKIYGVGKELSSDLV